MRVVLTFALVMFAASPALAFEGELRASLSSEQGVAAKVVAQYGKSGDVRMDIRSTDPSGQATTATTIMPAKGDSYYSIAHEQKVIVAIPYSTLAATSQQVKGSGDAATLVVKKLGREVVSGVDTEHVRIIDKDNDAVIELWLTQRYPADLWTRAFRGRNLGLEMSDNDRSKAMLKYGVKPGFSMKMRVDQAGGVPVVFLVERIERRTVPASAFELPKDYRRIDGASAPRP